MRIITTAQEMHHLSLEWRKEGKTIGFVPTMGALHEGHLSLVRAARQECDAVVSSIFVNPTQFGPNEDFEKYPRPFEQDSHLLENEGCDVLFYPTVTEIYGKTEDNGRKTLTWVKVKKLQKTLCGANRPGHFDGVTTVVTKLFHIVNPDKAYFGQKDYQQSVIIRRMTEDLRFFIQIRVMPIVREASGLALSSRNKYLSKLQRKDAAYLYQALQLGEKRIHEGETKTKDIIHYMKAFIKENIPYAKIDYVSLVHPDKLKELKTVEDTAVIALAVWVGKARLIDNLIVKRDEE